jgi:plastocyanin
MKGIAAAFAIALILLAGCAQGSTNNPGGNDTAIIPGGSTGPANYSVNIQGFAFSPATLTIAAGSTVTWTNLDAAPHTITADDTSQFASGNIAQNGIFVHTFSAPGTYAYHCSIHTSMKGTIIVK